MDSTVTTTPADSPHISLRALLKRPTMQILAISRMATTLGIVTLSYGAMVYLAEKGEPQIVISMFGVTRYAAALAFGLAGGVLADQMSKRNALVYAYVLQAILCFAVPPIFGTDLPQLFVVMVLSSILGQLTIPAIKAATSLVATPMEVASASALITVTSGVSSALGSALLAPLLIKFGGIQAVMYGSGVILLIGAIRSRGLPNEPDKHSFWKAFDHVEWRTTLPSPNDTARWLVAHKGVGTILISGALVLGIFDAVSSVMPVYLRDVLHISPVDTVYVMAPGGIGFALGTMVGPLLINRIGERPIATASIIAMAAGCFGFYLIAHVTPFLAPLSPLGLLQVFFKHPIPAEVKAASVLSIPLALGSTMGGAAAQAYVNRRVPLSLQGSTFGRQELINNAVALMLVLLFGIVSTAVGPRVVFVIGPTVVFVMAVWFGQYSYRHSGAVAPSFGTVAHALLRFREQPFDDPVLDVTQERS